MRLFTLALCLLSAPVSAHELWIEPVVYQVAADANLTGRIVNGEEFEGAALAFIPQRFAHFVTISAAGLAPVPGRVGDSPALSMPAPAEGLVVVAYQSRPSTVDYATWEKFQRFADHKDLGAVLPQHEARGLPSENFREVYTRYSKSLIAVGNGAGADAATGLETEIVALTNPYTDNLSGGMRLQLLYRNAPRANEQIEIFERNGSGAVNIFMVRTNANGVATVPVKPGHEYMADAVVLREPSAQLANDTQSVWETLWANLTWATP